MCLGFNTNQSRQHFKGMNWICDSFWKTKMTGIMKAIQFFFNWGVEQGDVFT